MSTFNPLAALHDPSLPTFGELVKTLATVAICSAASPCPICKEPYDSNHPPVLLPGGCGHIFGRPCILKWFEQGGNTCPIDRKRQFAPPPRRGPQGDNELRENWSVVPFRGRHHHPFRPRRAAMRRTRESAHYLFLGGEIVGVNGELTLEGCRRVVGDLWYYTRRSVRRARRDIDGLMVLAIDEDYFSEAISDVLPLGISVPDSARPTLVAMARNMLSWHVQAGARGMAQAHMPSGELTRIADEFWVLHGRGDED